MILLASSVYKKVRGAKQSGGGKKWKHKKRQRKCVSLCVCAFVKKREEEREKVWVCVRLWKRGSVFVCVYEREKREHLSVWERERNRKFERECVSEIKRESLCLYVYVWEKRRERELCVRERGEGERELTRVCEIKRGSECHDDEGRDWKGVPWLCAIKQLLERER
jgi:hypothetical protein